ncbi:GIY-YIG nuclease family protein [Arthrobacter sp. Alg241-R88]|uniref:GIY-YIG nuclease family protein n=1 Tax=Arthrobacter sp. Alg241-R88 TaxID=2305984 RepID=UPI0013D06D1B|nr:GIY-YIG nuclease family protein [Arthrobacter sp. Alg241-R88]
MTQLPTDPCAVYRFYDSKGDLLYVGITGNLPTRTKAHEGSKPWWKEMSSMTVAHFETREEAREAEQVAIDSERPRYNQVRSVGKTPLHSFRVDDELWEAAKKRAEERGETLTEALRKFLRRYTR